MFLFPLPVGDYNQRKTIARKKRAMEKATFKNLS